MVWKPLRDQLDVKYEKILDQCVNTDKRLRTVTCADALAEMAAALNSEWDTSERPRRGHFDSESELNLDETFEESGKVSRVYSPDNSFNLQTDRVDGLGLPRTSSPIQTSWGSYTEDEKREIWKKRVLRKRPILFETYCSHRFPKKSYRDGHKDTFRRNLPRKVLIDDPRCKTPTPSVMKTSWSCIEEVQKREGILSSPLDIDFIVPVGDTPEEGNSRGSSSQSPLEDKSAGNRNELQNEDSQFETPLRNSSEDFKVLQREITENVRREMANQSPVTMESMTSPRDLHDRRKFVSRRTPRYKLARKKALLLSAVTRSFIPSSSDSDDDRPSHAAVINSNFNRNVSEPISAEDTSLATCSSTRNCSSVLPETNDSNVDPRHERSSVTKQQSERYSIQTITSVRRKFSTVKSGRYNTLDEISENDDNRTSRGFGKSFHGAISRCASNPNLIVIVPDSIEDKDHSRLNVLPRSSSSPNLSSISSLPREKKQNGETHPLKATGTSKKKQLSVEKRHIDTEGDFKVEDFNSVSDTVQANNAIEELHMQDGHKASASDKTKHSNKMEGPLYSSVRPRITRYKYSLNRRRPQCPIPDPLCANLGLKEGVKAKRIRYTGQMDPSFRGYCVNDKYHYYNKEANSESSTQMKEDKKKNRDKRNTKVRVLDQLPEVEHSSDELPITTSSVGALEGKESCRQRISQNCPEREEHRERNISQSDSSEEAEYCDVDCKGLPLGQAQRLNNQDHNRDYDLPGPKEKLAENESMVPASPDATANQSESTGPSEDESTRPIGVITKGNLKDRRVPTSAAVTLYTDRIRQPFGPTGPPGFDHRTRHGPSEPHIFMGPPRILGLNGPSRFTGHNQHTAVTALMNFSVRSLNPSCRPPGLFQHQRAFRRMPPPNFPFFTPFRFHRPPRFFPAFPTGVLPPRYFCSQRFPGFVPRPNGK